MGRRAQLFDLITQLCGAFIILSCHGEGKLLFQIAEGMGFCLTFLRAGRGFSVMMGIRLDLGQKRQNLFFKDIVAFTAPHAAYIFVILQGEGTDRATGQGEGLKNWNSCSRLCGAAFAELTMKVGEQFFRQVKSIRVQQASFLSAFGAKAEFGGFSVDDLR